MDLPKEEWEKYWNRIYVDEDSKQKLVNFGVLEEEFAARKLDRMTLSHHGAILLSGPPGTGKTSLAKGAANELAKGLDRPTVFKQMKVQNLFSSGFGDTPGLVEDAFMDVIEPAEAGTDVFQVLLLDEVESIFSNRDVLTGDNDPYDAVRAVNEALRLLDRIAELPGIYVIATSNQPRGIDRAFYDRTDEQIFLGNPVSIHRRDIFVEIFTGFNETFETSLPTTETGMLDLIEVSEGFSGRRIRKTVLSALSRDAETIRAPKRLSYDQILTEFHEKRSLLDQDRSATYIELGIEESLDAPPTGPNDKANGAEQSEETRRKDGTTPEMDVSDEDQTVAEDKDESPAQVGQEPAPERESASGETSPTTPAPSDADDTSRTAKGSEHDDANAPTESDGQLETRTVVHDRTVESPSAATRDTILRFFDDVLAAAGLDSISPAEALDDESLESVWYRLCMMRKLNEVRLSVGDVVVPVSVSYDQSGAERLRIPSPEVFGSTENIEGPAMTLAVTPDAESMTSDIAANQDELDITIETIEEDAHT